MHSETQNRLTLFIGAAALIASGALFAEGAAQGTGNPAASQPSSAERMPGPQDFSESQLEAFAEAQAEVRDIQSEYRSEAQQAQDQSEQTKIQQQANQEMVKAVKDAGLEVAEFNQIAQAARANPELAQEIRSYQ